MREEREEKEQEKSVRQGLLVPVGSLILMLILVLGSVVLVVYHDELNLDDLRRTITYHNIKTGANGAAEAFEFESDLTNLFASFDNGCWSPPPQVTGCLPRMARRW
jgi:hypothetical protein